MINKAAPDFRMFFAGERFFLLSISRLLGLSAQSPFDTSHELPVDKLSIVRLEINTGNILKYLSEQAQKQPIFRYSFIGRLICLKYPSLEA